MIWVVGAGGTPRRYCRECGDPLSQAMAAEAVFCSGRCRSRRWRRLQRTRQGWLRCSGVSRRSARFAGGRGRWEWNGRGQRCTARTVAGCGPAASGGRHGTALQKRHSRTPLGYLEHQGFCKVIGRKARALIPAGTGAAPRQERAAPPVPTARTAPAAPPETPTARSGTRTRRARRLPPKGDPAPAEP